MRRRRRFSRKLLAVAGIFVLGGAGWFYHGHKATKQTAPPGIQNVVTYSTDKPSEKPLNSSNYNSSVAPDEPKYISLPTIKASGYVQKVGIDQNGQVAAPNNVNLAGWYVNSLKPGQDGLSVIDGHVDGLTSIGIFFRLGKLKAGDKFQVTLGNGTQQTYAVKQVSQVAAGAAARALFSRDNSIKSQLNLITCGGVFDRSTHSYESRTVVISELVSS